MKLLNLFLAIIMTTTLISCGNSLEESHLPYEQGAIQLQSADDFTKYIQEAKVSTTAPKGLGLLINRDEEESIGTCTWFLVNKDTALTNSHCIPEVLKQESSLNCSRYIGGVFNTDNGIESRRCKQVVHFSEITEESSKTPDYAIIKLDTPVDSSIDFEISRKGFSDGETSRVHAINTLVVGDEGGYLYGLYIKRDCISYQKSIIGSFTETNSSIIPVFHETSDPNGCGIISGNSGSPVSSRTNFNVIGIAFATQGKALPSAEVLDFSDVNRYGLVTNLACMDLKDAAEKRDDRCEQLLESELSPSSIFSDELQADMINNVMKVMVTKISSLPKGFKYDIADVESDDSMFQVKLKCMLPLDKWSESDRPLDYKRERYEGSLPTYQLDFRLEVDNYARLQHVSKVKQVDSFYFNIYDLKEVSSEKRSVGEAPLLELKLRLCSEDEASETVSEMVTNYAERSR